MIARLEDSAPGCQWVRARWNELGALLKDGLNWRAPERFRAFRLLGIHPSDALFTSELTSLLQACETLDPGAGSLVAEVWNEVVSAEALPSLIETYQRESRHSRAWNETAARQYLLRVVETAIMRVDAKEKYHAFRAEVERDLAEPLSCFDESREGSLMRRYEETCGRDILRNIAELRACQARRQGAGTQTIGGYFARPSSNWLPGTDVLSETAAQAGWGGCADFQCGDDLRETADLDEAAAFSSTSVELRNEASQTDFEIVESESWHEDAVRNEPSAGLDDLDEDVSRPDDVLRNEPSQSGVETVDSAGAAESVSRNEPTSVARGDSRNALGDQAALERPTPTTVQTEKAVESPRAATFPGLRRDRPHENLIEASRRERRKRKREERRARGRAR